MGLPAYQKPANAEVARLIPPLQPSFHRGSHCCAPIVRWALNTAVSHRVEDSVFGHFLIRKFATAGEAAIYTEHFRELSLLRKILLRMRGWQNYVYPESL
jgi:hypothetical protein